MDGRFLVLLTVFMEFIGSLISFIVGYYAIKSYRTSSSRGLVLLHLGFTVLGVGIFLRAVSATYFAFVLRFARVETPALALMGLLNLAGFIYTVTQLVAYSLFAATYLLHGRTGDEQIAALGTVSAAVFPIYRLFFIPQLELIAIVMLGFVAAYSCSNWLLKRSDESALVFLGFGLMFTSHLLFLFTILEGMLLFLGQVTQLAGFLCMLAMLIKVSKAHA